MTTKQKIEQVLFRARQVAAREGVSEPTIWRWVANGKFPKPIKISEGVTAWHLTDLMNWEKSRM